MTQLYYVKINIPLGRFPECGLSYIHVPTTMQRKIQDLTLRGVFSTPIASLNERHTRIFAFFYFGKYVIF